MILNSWSAWTHQVVGEMPSQCTINNILSCTFFFQLVGLGFFLGGGGCWWCFGSFLFVSLGFFLFVGWGFLFCICFILLCCKGVSVRNTTLRTSCPLQFDKDCPDYGKKRKTKFIPILFIAVHTSVFSVALDRKLNIQSQTSKQMDILNT